MIKAGIIGGAGYTGGEMIRLLLNHPQVTLSFVHSRSNSGNPLHHAHPDLQGETDLLFTDAVGDADILFLCLGHGESKKFLQENVIKDSTRVIDLSHDFRLGDTVPGRTFIYGLPELNAERIRNARNVANPGCFATAIELGLLPLAEAGLLSEIYTTGITGSTGAGQKLQDTTHFTWRANNISAYKTLTHQHLGEINAALIQLQPSYKSSLHFVPWRGDFTRGIFVSSVVKTPLAINELKSLYQKFYQAHPFTYLSDGVVDLKQVVNTNKCIIGIEREKDTTVIHSVIDNLLKGASGQAVQNMNLMFGLDQREGLRLKSTVF